MPDKNLIRLGERVRQVRKESNLSQQKVSEKSGLALRTISRIERGLMNPSFEVLVMLATGLGVSVEYLFTYSSDEDDAGAHELVNLYHSSTKQGQQVILAATRAIAYQLREADTEQ